MKIKKIFRNWQELKILIYKKIKPKVRIKRKFNKRDQVLTLLEIKKFLIISKLCLKKIKLFNKIRNP